MEQRFDVVVVGGGHAGTEAAAAAARMGARTLLLSHDPARIGEMSCNPAIGGIGKGHIVRELDALDGIMPRAADLAGIHFKLLNRSKGPAVRGPRAQADRRLYREAVQGLLAETPNLTLRAGSAEDLLLSPQGAAEGVVTADGTRLLAGAVVLTAGTFLRGVIHVGLEQTPAGRHGEAPAIGLAHALARIGLPLGRLKTGTPPRLARSSIDWDGLAPDPGDDTPEPFSRLTAGLPNPQITCRITATTEATHALIRANLHLSAVYGGAISGNGPRYCPSIEDKVVRFADRTRHQIFLEPEGLDDPLVYPNGISTSLPAPVQAALVATIPGLERARIVRPGYAVEYDFVDPRALEPSLECASCPRLFLAGQVNGTTGYEEAAGQGVVAGINAALRAGGGDPVRLDRGSAYIGVMVDDLTRAGVREPYRMFTSRAEFRLSLRADNADLRLTPLGLRLGCVGAQRAAAFRADQAAIEAALARARGEECSVEACAAAGLALPGTELRRTVLQALAAVPLQRLCAMVPWLGELRPRVRTHLEAEAQYGGYLERQAREVQRLQAADAMPIPDGLDYRAIGGLSTEMGEILTRARPSSVGALGRLPGVTPAAVVAVLGHLRQRARG